MTMPPRLQLVGESERSDHFYLPAGAQCFFWGEYTPYEHTEGRRWDFSPTNQLIANFKKKMDRQGRADWSYKTQAIRRVARHFAQSFLWESLHRENHVALIPIPPSKASNDPMYDPRMAEMLRELAGQVQLPLDIRDCLRFSGVHDASHESNSRPTPDQLYEQLRFDPEVGRPHEPPGTIFVFDDMLTTGAHYVAVTRKLAEIFPAVPIVGIFIARRLVPNPFDDLDDVFDDLDDVL